MQMQMQTVALVFFVEEKPLNQHRLCSKACGGDDSSLFFQKPQREFQRYWTHRCRRTTTFSSPSYQDELRAGFSPALCSTYLLLSWDLPSSWGLHCSHAPQASLVMLQVPQATANGLGKLQRATALSDLQQTAHGSQDLHQPFIRNHKPERFIMRLPSASGPINSRTNNLRAQPTACTHSHTLVTSIFDCLCSDPYTPSKICMFLEHAASKTSWCAHFYINIVKHQVSLNSKS